MYDFKRNLKIIAIITYPLLSIIAGYFKYFPTFINAHLTNICISFFVFFLLFLLIVGAFIITEPKDIYYLLPQSICLIFLVRAIPNLRLLYPPLHDPYFYTISMVNILDYMTLQPFLNWWYGSVGDQLHWPMMQILTVELVQLADIDFMQAFRFQEPAMGIIFFVGVFYLAKKVANNNIVALLSGLIASLSEITIFYQSEYHPQGLAFIYFVFMLCGFVISRKKENISYEIVTVLFIFAFIFVHHFSSLFIGLMCIGYVLLLDLFVRIKLFRYLFDLNLEIVSIDLRFWSLVIVSSISIHFLFYDYLINTLINSFGETKSAFILITTGGEVPIYVTILSSLKWVIFILIFVSIFWLARTKESIEFRLAIFVISVVIVGAFANQFKLMPLDRIIGFYISLGSIFASLTIFRFNREWFRNIATNKKILVTALFIPIILTSGIFNSQSPGYFFKNSGVDTYYAYSNDLSSMARYEVTGKWIADFTEIDSKYDTEFDTIVIPFFYAKRPFINIARNILNDNENYIIINPKINYGTLLDKSAYINSINILYKNGVLLIGDNGQF